jgi:hypothetical protein
MGAVIKLQMRRMDLICFIMTHNIPQAPEFTGDIQAGGKDSVSADY